MNDKKEAIKMLELLKEQAKGDNRTTQIDNVSLDSFLFVISNAISIIEEV